MIVSLLEVLAISWIYGEAAIDFHGALTVLHVTCGSQLQNLVVLTQASLVSSSFLFPNEQRPMTFRLILRVGIRYMQ